MKEESTISTDIYTEEAKASAEKAQAEVAVEDPPEEAAVAAIEANIVEE